MRDLDAEIAELDAWYRGLPRWKRVMITMRKARLRLNGFVYWRTRRAWCSVAGHDPETFANHGGAITMCRRCAKTL